MGIFITLKVLHTLGLSMVIGGTLVSLLITLRFKGDPGADKGTFVSSHLVSAPGLIVVILSGLTLSATMQWAQFKGAGYMHSKMLLVVLVAIFLAIEIRTLGVMRRAEKVGQLDAIRAKAVRKRIVAGTCSFITLLAIVVTIVAKPF